MDVYTSVLIYIQVGSDCLRYTRAVQTPVFVFLLILTFFAFYFHAKFHASRPKIDQVMAILVHDPLLRP